MFIYAIICVIMIRCVNTNTMVVVVYVYFYLSVNVRAFEYFHPIPYNKNYLCTVSLKKYKKKQ